MKRALFILLAFTMIFSMISCSSGSLSDLGETATATAETKTEKVTTPGKGKITLPDGFSVGFGRSDMTPTIFPIHTYHGEIAARAVTNLYVTSVAVSDGENVVLFISVDSRGITETMASISKKRIANTFHIPQENVILTATHTHSGVDIARETQSPIDSWFNSFYSVWLPSAVEESLRDLTPATMSHGQSHVEACYNRRYLLNDGTWLSTRYTAEGQFAVGSESEVDDTMNLLYFERENKKDVAFLNFQCHPSSSDWATVSADWIDPLRTNVEKKYDALFSFYQGAAGVLMHKTILPGALNLTKTQEVGDHFTEAFTVAYDAKVPAQTGKIKVATSNTVGKLIEVTEAEYAELDRYNAADENEQANILPWFVANVRGKIRQYSKKNMTEVNIPHTAVSFGDVGIATAGYELFHEQGLYVKENSPFKITLIFGYTDQNLGYIPPETSFPHGEYEVNSCIFVAGTAEDVGDSMLALIKQVAE